MWSYSDSSWNTSDYSFLKVDTTQLKIVRISYKESQSFSKIVDFNVPNPLSINSVLASSNTLYERILGRNTVTGKCYTSHPLFFDVLTTTRFPNGDSTEINLLYLKESKPLNTSIGEFFQYLVHVGDSGKVEYTFRKERGIMEERRFKYTPTGEKKLVRKVTLLKAELF